MSPHVHGRDSRAERELKLAHVIYRETVQSVEVGVPEHTSSAASDFHCIIVTPEWPSWSNLQDDWEALHDDDLVNCLQY